MKAKVSLSTLLLVVVCFSSCSNKKTWVEANGMKGNIISFTDTTWYATDKFGEVHKEWIENYTKVELNEYGQITAITKYDRYDNIEEKTVQEWKDKYTISSITKYNSDGNAASKEIYKFDGDKVSSVAINDYSDNTEEILTYEYDGDRLSKITGKKKGKTKTLTFTYLGENDSYKEVDTDYDGTKTESTSYFDSDGRIITWLYGGDKYTYQYDKNGLVEKTTYSHFVNTFDYKFDDKGNWIERIEHERWGKQKTTIKSYIVRSIEYKR